MSSLGPRLPTELVDYVISYALDTTADTNNGRILSYYALVGRLWRDRVNARRFSHLCIDMAGHTTALLQTLADICLSTVWPAQESVARHVKTFSLLSGIQSGDAADTCDGRSIRDAAIIAVLRGIFGDKARRGGGVAADLILGPGHKSSFHFATLGHAVIAALDDLLRTADLEQLTLTGALGIPWSFVLPETLRYLSLEQVVFIPPKEESVGSSVPRQFLLPKLAHMNLNDSPSFITRLISQSYCTPPPVTTMEITHEAENHDGEFRAILSHLGDKLESLTINITGEFYDICTPIDYSKVHVLDYLHIDMEYNIDHGEEDRADIQQIPAFETMVRLLPPAPPCDMRIVFAVSIFYFDPPDSSSRCVEDVYSEIYDPSFPEYLQRISSETPGISIYIVLYVSVHLDPGLTCGSAETYKEHGEYLLKQFACLTGMSGITFRVDVSEYDDLHVFRSLE